MVPFTSSAGEAALSEQMVGLLLVDVEDRLADAHMISSSGAAAVLSARSIIEREGKVGWTQQAALFGLGNVEKDRTPRTELPRESTTFIVGSLSEHLEESQVGT